MSLITITKPDDILFETQFTEEELEPLPPRRGWQMANRITCIVPKVFNLVDLYSVIDRPIPENLQQQFGEYEFWLVQFAWILHHAHKSVINWAEFQVELSYHAFIPPDAEWVLHEFNHDLLPTDDVTNCPPIVYTIHPVKITDEKDIDHVVRLSPNLTFDNASAETGEGLLTITYKKLYPRIVAYGEYESKFCWRFLPNVRSIEEGTKEMNVIIRKKPNSIVGGMIRIAGKGQIGGTIFISEQKETETFYF